MEIVITFFCFLFLIGAIVLYRKSEKEAKKDQDRKQEEEKRLLEESRKRQEEYERHLREMEELYHSDPKEYFEYYLIQNETVTNGEDATCVFSDGILGVDVELPTKDEVRDIYEDNYLTKSGTVRASFETTTLPKLYETHLYTLCLSCIEFVFIKDSDSIVTSVLYNGYVTDFSKTTGQLERRLVMSILVNRNQFTDIDLSHVDPKACFKSLKGVSSSRLIDFTPVMPVLRLNKEDRRFIDNRQVIVGERTNLAAMPWEDFEQLVRDLFESEFSKNGSEVKVTQASRDGGVDAVVFDPDPLRGGKIVIQAKRYTNTIPVSAVRDLYGTVINEGANTGILITTSDYGPDSYEFAKDKPLKLLNGGHLLGLMERNGRQAYINLKEAKDTITEERKSIPEAPPKDLFGFEQ